MGDNTVKLTACVAGKPALLTRIELYERSVRSVASDASNAQPNNQEDPAIARVARERPGM